MGIPTAIARRSERSNLSDSLRQKGRIMANEWRALRKVRAILHYHLAQREGDQSIELRKRLSSIHKEGLNNGKRAETYGSPKERVNIVYQSDLDGRSNDVELPFKLMVLSDFTLRENPEPLEDRKPVGVDKTNFDNVMKAHGLIMNLDVPNRLAEGAMALPVSLSVSTLADFGPDSIVQQVPELKRLMELREALRGLKGPLGNIPEFRSKLQQVVKDNSVRVRLLAELGIEEA